MFLSFTDNLRVKRVSYAASFGVDDVNEYSDDNLKVCASLLKKFDAVSVREKSGIILCKSYFGVDACQVVDPTLLLKAEDYSKLFRKNVKYHLKNKLLVYFLDDTEEKRKIAIKIATERGLDLFYVNGGIDNIDIPLKHKVRIGIEEWLRYLSESSYVVTDSFHGCVFSLIFKKQFVAIGNKSRGLSRFKSLMDMFSLRQRLIYSIEDYESNIDLLKQNIDYEKVDSILRREREYSLHFLNNALGICNNASVIANVK